MKEINDEIKISDALLYLKRGIKSVVLLIGFIKNVLIKNLILLLLVLICFGIVGFFSGHDKTEHYEAGITCTYNDLHKKSYGEMIVILNDYLKDHQYEYVAKSLGITNLEAQSILSIKAQNVTGGALQEDFSQEKLPFYIKYIILNPTYASKINSGIMYYLQNCSYNTVRRNIRVNNAHQKIAFLAHQLNQMDSIKLAYYNYFEKGRNGSSEPIDLKVDNLFKESEVLFNNKQDAEWVIHFDNSVETIYEVMPIKINISATHYKNMALSLICGFIVFIILFSLIEIYKTNE